MLLAQHLADKNGEGMVQEAQRLRLFPLNSLLLYYHLSNKQPAKGRFSLSGSIKLGLCLNSRLMRACKSLWHNVYDVGLCLRRHFDMSQEEKHRSIQKELLWFQGFRYCACWLTVTLGHMNNRAFVNVISNTCAYPTMTSQNQKGLLRYTNKLPCPASEIPSDQTLKATTCALCISVNFLNPDRLCGQACCWSFGWTCIYGGLGVTQFRERWLQGLRYGPVYTKGTVFLIKNKKAVSLGAQAGEHWATNRGVGRVRE